MATRFYLPSTPTSAGVDITPGFGGWTATTEMVRRTMSPVKIQSAMANIDIWANGAVAANATRGVAQFISEPLASGIAFATTDTVKCYIRAAESAANDNINRQPIMLKVYAADGTTLQATLLALAHVGPNTTEWNTSLRSKTWADGDVLAANYTTVAGDRLVLEVGAQVDATGGTTVTGSISFGDNSATDIAETELVTTADNPWFEISRTCTFQPSPQRQRGMNEEILSAFESTMNRW